MALESERSDLNKFSPRNFYSFHRSSAFPIPSKFPQQGLEWVQNLLRYSFDIFETVALVLHNKRQDALKLVLENFTLKCLGNKVWNKNGNI